MICSSDIPKFRDLGLELLFAVAVVSSGMSDPVTYAGATLVNGKLLLVALEVLVQLLHALFEMLLARLGADQRLAR